MASEFGRQFIEHAAGQLGAAVLVLSAVTACAQPEERAYVAPPVPPGRDIPGSQLSFSEEFDGPLSVSAWGCDTRWIAHTPWAGDFGDAPFADPIDGFPFSVNDGVLSIEARRQADGTWRSGMLSAWDACDSGEVMLYGYFEMRARMPAEPGVWPAFWLIGADFREEGSAEIDVLEFYSRMPEKFSSSLRDFNRKEPEKSFQEGHWQAVPDGQLTSQFNTFGVEITPEFVAYFFNGEEYWRLPQRAEFRQPMFPLVSLAVIEADMGPSTPDSIKLEVDYIRGYQSYK